MNFKYLDESRVRQLLQSRAALVKLVDAMADALKAFSARDSLVVNPVRSVVPVASAQGFLGCMPALCPVESGEALGVKLVAWYPENKPPVATHHATVAMFDPPTGQLSAILDGETLTELRTAAVSTAATRALADPNAKVLAILGSGVQASGHILVHLSSQHYTDVKIWSRTRSNAEQLATGSRQTYSDTRFTVCESAEDAARDADVICVCTGSKEPVLLGSWVKAGAHVNAVGACRPEWRELDDELLHGSDVYVDSVDAAKKESGDIILSACEVSGELGQVVRESNRHDPRRKTVFKSLGLAVEDVAAAHLVLQLDAA